MSHVSGCWFTVCMAQFLLTTLSTQMCSCLPNLMQKFSSKRWSSEIEDMIHSWSSAPWFLKTIDTEPMVSFWKWNVFLFQQWSPFFRNSWIQCPQRYHSRTPPVSRTLKVVTHYIWIFILSFLPLQSAKTLFLYVWSLKILETLLDSLEIAPAA